MSRHSIVIWFFAAAALFTVACGGSAKKSGKLENSADSLSYVVGMNIAYNIMNMDTTMRAEAIIAGIEDAFAGAEKIFTIMDMVPEVVDDEDAIELEEINHMIDSKDAQSEPYTPLPFDSELYGLLNLSSNTYIYQFANDDIYYPYDSNLVNFYENNEGVFSLISI